MNDVTNQAALAAPPASEEPPSQAQAEPAVEFPIPSFESERIFALARPIEWVAAGKIENITELRLRAPIGRDIFEVKGGVSKTFWTPTGMGTDWDTDRLREYLIRLSGRPGSFIDKLAGRDISAMREWINRELQSITGN
jgi:hypothetical protein